MKKIIIGLKIIAVFFVLCWQTTWALLEENFGINLGVVKSASVNNQHRLTFLWMLYIKQPKVTSYNMQRKQSKTKITSLWKSLLRCSFPFLSDLFLDIADIRAKVWTAPSKPWSSREKNKCLSFPKDLLCVYHFYNEILSSRVRWLHQITFLSFTDHLRSHI